MKEIVALKSDIYTDIRGGTILLRNGARVPIFKGGYVVIDRGYSGVSQATIIICLEHETFKRIDIDTVPEDAREFFRSKGVDVWDSLIEGEMVCPCGCGETFMPKYPNQKYLNAEHRLRHYKEVKANA